MAYKTIAKDKVRRTDLADRLEYRVLATKRHRGGRMHGVKPSGGMVPGIGVFRKKVAVVDIKAELNARVVDYCWSIAEERGVARTVNRCVSTGRARAVNREFRVNRIKLRDDALLGALPGVSKKSW